MNVRRRSGDMDKVPSLSIKNAVTQRIDAPTKPEHIKNEVSKCEPAKYQKVKNAVSDC